MLSTRAQRSRPALRHRPRVSDRRGYWSEWPEAESDVYLETVRPRGCGGGQLVGAVRRDHRDAWHGLVEDRGRLWARTRPLALSTEDAQDWSMPAALPNGPGSAARTTAGRRQVRRQLRPSLVTDTDLTGVLLANKSIRQKYSWLTEIARRRAAARGAR